ncbi:MAG TPA: RNA polymerase sigma factor [Thermoanaerobaculia bacterium]|jgi:RNA polymerase sigma-70 factor (ECF subfamily)
MAPDPEPTGDDRQWAEALIRHGDEQAFRRLYRRHTPRLYGFTLRLLGGSRADAEDVVQETWVRAVRQLDRFRWQSSLATWLCGIALNLGRNQLRRTGRREEKEAALPRPRQAPAPGGLRIDLERAVALLPAGCRTILLLHDVEGWTHEEIARDLGIAAGTSKSQLSEARRRLRERLEGARHETARTVD